MGEITRFDPADLAVIGAPLARPSAGQIANQAAAAAVFASYRLRLADASIRRQDNDLKIYAAFLAEAGTPTDPAALADDPAAWAGTSWGLVEAFQQWLLHKGYAIGTANGAVSTVKLYAGMAMKAGAVDESEHARIALVKGFSQKQIRRVNEKREVTRIGGKKERFIALSPLQVEQLKTRPNTAQGRRDAVLLCILLDHGLRCGELALLEVRHVDLTRGTFTFYRPKVQKEQTHDMTFDTRVAVRNYLAGGGPTSGALLQTTRKGGAITGQGMSERAITGRVAYLGQQLGVEGLSAHDLRHTWATLAARAGTPLDRLMEAGGWNSMAMPLRYIEAARIANEGVRL